MSKSTVMRWSKPTDEAGRVVVDPAIIKAVQDGPHLHSCKGNLPWICFKKMLEELTDTPVELGISSEWGYDATVLKKPLFIFISQSGETADSRQVWLRPMKWNSKLDSDKRTRITLQEANHTMLLLTQALKLLASTKAYTAQIAALAFLAKQLVKQMVTKKPGHLTGSRVVYRSTVLIESTLSKKELIDAEVRDPETTRNALHRTWSRLLCSHGSQSQAQRDLHPMMKVLRLGSSSMERLLWLKMGHPWPSCQTQSFSPTTPCGNIQEVVARGAASSPSQKKMLPKIQMVMFYDRTLLTSPIFNGRTTTSY